MNIYLHLIKYITLIEILLIVRNEPSPLFREGQFLADLCDSLC